MTKLNSGILIKTVTVTRKDSLQFFQVNIPDDVTAIVGIETGIQVIAVPGVLTVNNRIAAGLLQLQSTGKPNLCYSSEVMTDQVTATMQDIGYRAYIAGFAHNAGLATNSFAQGGNKETEDLRLPYCKTLYGSYHDLMGAKLNADINYNITIAVWVEQKQD